jgi:cell shape-determining protein MreD
MIYLFYMMVFLGAIVFNTTIVVHLSLFYGFYDLLLPFVIYLGFYRSIRESLVFIIFFGIAMDAISGGPFGLYTISYIWLYVFVMWLTRFMRVTNNMILPGVVICSVVIQNTIFLASMFLSGPDVNIPSFSFRIVFLQIVWGIFTGPVFILLLRSVNQRLEKWQRSFQSDLGQ